MSLTTEMNERCGGICELCGVNEASEQYTVSPKEDHDLRNQVALCATCLENMEDEDCAEYWRILEGSIWNPEPAVQALSYRLLHLFKDQEWAGSVMHSVDIDDAIKDWALSVYEKPDVHQDAFGNELSGGDNVVLTQALNVKGTSFSAAKGTIVKKIRLVPGNTDQIEGKINEQTIVILTKFVKKA